MPNYGLIGEKLSHSFSKAYFEEKFQREQINNCTYQLFELSRVEEVIDLIGKEDIKGFNITIPYKEEIIPFLNEIEDSALKIGAVNVVKVGDGGGLTGFNSDYYGFKTSLEKWMGWPNKVSALILGTGGAAKAVGAVLEDLGVDFRRVSRSGGKGVLTYDQISEEIILAHQLIINTTPLGMHLNINSRPDIPYRFLSDEHYLYDLVYNPEETAFMKEGLTRGSKVKNGLEMLYLQAEKSWQIWNS